MKNHWLKKHSTKFIDKEIKSLLTKHGDLVDDIKDEHLKQQMVILIENQYLINEIKKEDVPVEIVLGMFAKSIVPKIVHFYSMISPQLAHPFQIYSKSRMVAFDAINKDNYVDVASKLRHEIELEVYKDLVNNAFTISTVSRCQILKPIQRYRNLLNEKYQTETYILAPKSLAIFDEMDCEVHYIESASNSIIVGLKPDPSNFQEGYVYAPYVPLSLLTVEGPETLRQHGIIRYGKSLTTLGKNQFARIDVI